MKILAFIVGILFLIIMLASVLTANSRWAGKMNDWLKKFFYGKEGDQV
jgi:hypothetical protein